MSQNRVPRGTPDGGQFSHGARPEPDSPLLPPKPGRSNAGQHTALEARLDEASTQLGVAQARLVAAATAPRWRQWFRPNELVHAHRAERAADRHRKMAQLALAEVAGLGSSYDPAGARREISESYRSSLGTNAPTRDQGRQLFEAADQELRALPAANLSDLGTRAGRRRRRALERAEARSAAGLIVMDHRRLPAP